MTTSYIQYIKVNKYLNIIYNLDFAILLSWTICSPVCFITVLSIIICELVGLDKNGGRKFYYCCRYWNSPSLFIKDVYPILILLFTILNIFLIVYLLFPQIKKNILKKILKISEEEIDNELHKIFNQMHKRNIEKENKTMSITFNELRKQYL